MSALSLPSDYINSLHQMYSLDEYEAVTIDGIICKQAVETFNEFQMVYKHVCKLNITVREASWGSEEKMSQMSLVCHLIDLTFRASTDWASKLYQIPQQLGAILRFSCIYNSSHPESYPPEVHELVLTLANRHFDPRYKFESDCARHWLVVMIEAINNCEAPIEAQGVVFDRINAHPIFCERSELLYQLIVREHIHSSIRTRAFEKYLNLGPEVLIERFPLECRYHEVSLQLRKESLTVLTELAEVSPHQMTMLKHLINWYRTHKHYSCPVKYAINYFLNVQWENSENQSVTDLIERSYFPYAEDDGSESEYDDFSESESENEQLIDDY